MLITIQFIIFLRLVSAIRQNKQVIINPHQDTIIDTFSGILLESEFIFPDNFHHENPCTLIQQQLELVSIYGKNNQKIFQDFAQNFVDGYFNTTIDSLKQIAIIGRGLLVLSDSGILSFYTIQNENMNLRSQKQFLELNGLLKIQIYLIKEQILIFTEKDIWLLHPDFSQFNIFNNSELLEIQSFSEQLTMQKVIIFKQLIYITLNENEFRIYEFENNQLKLLSSMIDKNVSIKDIQVLQVEEVQHILILDNYIKIQFYSFWEKNNFLIKNQEMKSISTLGDSFLLFHNKLYLITNFVEENFFSIKVLALNFTDNMFEQLFNIEFQGIIKDMLITENFIVAYSNNSISIIQNLVDETSQIYLQHFYIPNIQQMVLLSFDNQHLYLAGINKYNQFAYRIYVDKIFIKCNVPIDFPKQFSFQYLVKTTYFNESQKLNYTVYLQGRNKIENHIHNILLVIYVFFCLKVCIIIGIVHQYIQYKKYTKSEQLIEQKQDNLKTTERQQNVALNLDSKEQKTTDYDKSPDPSSRITQSPNEFSN